jgi:hypothetical protein
MSVIKTVSAGQPIKASWANSLVNEVNTKSGLKMKSRPVNTSINPPILPENMPAWHISSDDGIYSLNAGQVYINNILVPCKVGSYN